MHPYCMWGVPGDGQVICHNLCIVSNMICIVMAHSENGLRKGDPLGHLVMYH